MTGLQKPVCRMLLKEAGSQKRRWRRLLKKKMNLLKLLDKMCEVTSIMADIIRKQQAVIEMHGIEVEDPELGRQLDSMDMILDEAELTARNI